MIWTRIIAPIQAIVVGAILVLLKFGKILKYNNGEVAYININKK